MTPEAVRTAGGDPRYLAVVDRQFNKRVKAQWDPLNVFRHALSIARPSRGAPHT